VLINWDSRAGDAARAASALAKSGLAGVETWALAAPFEEKVRFQTDREWMGELPRTRLIARDGSVTYFSRAADFDKIAAWISGQR